MSDPATRIERVQRRLRRHLQVHPSSRLRVLRRLVLDTRARRDRSCGDPYCPCADTGPACPQWEGTDDWPVDRCPRCGAPRTAHDHQEATTA